MPATARWPRRVVISAVFTLTLLATAVPADAHPYGYPQAVTIAPDAARPDVVHLTWKPGGVDELTLLGVHLGVLPQDRVLLDGAVDTQENDATILVGSKPFADYLLEQMTASSDGQACAGVIGKASDTGVDVDYTCPGPLGIARIEIRMLSDLDPAYRTVATGPKGKRQVYGPDEYSHDWVLDDAPPPAVADSGTGHDQGTTQRIALAVGPLLLVAAAGSLLRRQVRRRRITRIRPSS
ncbi:hypothetical protein [Micromonospora sp. WMMC250]|uniref:hypothetical protein n=1 Tax=Micromonospora sp. WMMC250 TaxID=3014781 RepID=UPI0022B74D5A|nr:hypothetical protein [Micromonospora sp. WMMC250]MCZ7377239.1 hypothetical protein [Micromonospora sp. WMMC250]